MAIAAYTLISCHDNQGAELTVGDGSGMPILPAEPPTATETDTPEPPVTLTSFPDFHAIQTQVAGDNYTIMGNGDVESKLPDGTNSVIR